MSRVAAERLQAAIDDFKLAYRNDPRFKDVLGSLDGAMTTARKTMRDVVSSPGQDAARKAAGTVEEDRPYRDDEQVKRSSEETEMGGQMSNQEERKADAEYPRDYATAREMAKARYARE